MIKPRPDPDQIARLAAWMSAWRAAQESYFSWAKDEFSKRLATFIETRRKARVVLVRQAQAHIPFDSQGRVDLRSRTLGRAKDRFRAGSDEVFSAIVKEGENVFGIKGDRNRAGVYVGQMDPALRRLALKRVREALGEAADAADAAEKTLHG
jgi:hypothetical protein